MVIVSGAARTGTSMMMQTLMHLGYPMVAPPFLDVHKDVVEYNPKGFYELDIPEIKAIDKSQSGKAAKIFGVCLGIYDICLADKMIVMIRDKEDAVKSSIPVYEGLGYKDFDGAEAYDLCYKFINMVSPELPTIFINFEEIISAPEKEIIRLVEFLGIKSDKDRINKAVENIKHN